MTAGAGEEEPMRALLTAEHGGVVVMVAIFLPVLILFAGFVIDIGNWFAHKRHLQTQADAAALAGAVEFRLPCEDSVNAAIEAKAVEYSGEGATGYNHQLGGTDPDEIHIRLNARNWYENSGPVDDTVVEGPPCEAGMVDVKMTETDLPLFLHLAGWLFPDVDYINTQARVELFQSTRFTRSLPVAVPDNDPRVGRVIFVDETTGTQLGSRPLQRNGSDGNLALWDNSTDPFPLAVESERIGVRVAFGGASSTTCGDPLVACYDLGGPDGILHVRGYSMADSGAQPGPPLARTVYLYPAAGPACPDPYFVHVTEACNVGVHAEVDFGPCGAGGTPPHAPGLTARADKRNYALSLVSCEPGSSLSVWETSGTPIPVNPAAGPMPVELRWEETQGTVGSNGCTTGGNNPCKGSFGTVQRVFSASDDRSGPVRSAQLWEGGSAWANSFERCSSVQASCTYSVIAKIAVDRNLSENADSVNDEVVALRFGANSGSQNQALDCDPAITNLRDEIARGCGPTYVRNTGTACPSTTRELWASPQPWECVAVATGDATGQIWQGMNLRVHGSESPETCVSPNHWADFPDFDRNDPRIVPVLISPFGTFSGTGSENVPVTGGAIFYATGWHGSQSLCPDDDPAPSKSMVGHFIKYVQILNDQGTGSARCDFTELAPCVAVMTR